MHVDWDTFDIEITPKGLPFIMTRGGGASESSGGAEKLKILSNTWTWLIHLSAKSHTSAGGWAWNCELFLGGGGHENRANARLRFDALPRP